MLFPVGISNLRNSLMLLQTNWPGKCPMMMARITAPESYAGICWQAMGACNGGRHCCLKSRLVVGVAPGEIGWPLRVESRCVCICRSARKFLIHLSGHLQCGVAVQVGSCDCNCQMRTGPRPYCSQVFNDRHYRIEFRLLASVARSKIGWPLFLESPCFYLTIVHVV